MYKRILSAALFFLFLLASAFGKEKILHSETKYFDIIFDESSRESADELFECADEILEELCLQYKVEPDFKIPLVITSRTENFNAYFTNYNYNHLVIYNTTPTESLMEFSSTIKSTFIHELTHLVSNNARNGFWKTTGKYFGDTYNPGFYITMTSFFKEGASVFQESRNGEGRLNDGFFLHPLKQAKISGKFPGYTDCFGARTIYPSGTSTYLFGSAFTEYIISKYGMDKYAEFWHRGTNSNRLTSTAVFKKTYGVSMKKEWKNFYDSIDIEGIEKNPETVNGISKTDFKNKALHVYSVLGIKNDEKIILDETTSSVFIGSKKVFTKTGLISAKSACNGKYIVTTCLDYNHLDTKIKAEYFNTETGAWKNAGETGIKNLTIIKNEGVEFLIRAKTHSQNSSIEITELGKDEKILCSADFSKDEIPYSLCGDSNGNLWFLFKEGLNFYLCKAVFSESNISIKKFSLGNIRPRNLSIYKENENVGKTTLLFSYAENKSFPRLAIAEETDGQIKLRLVQKDVSGGIYSPVTDGNKIIYAANFYDESSIYELDLESFASEAKTFTTLLTETALQNTKGAFENSADNFSFSDYKKILYPGKTIVPLSILSSYYIGPSVYLTAEEDCLSQASYSYLLGMTVIKSNPWDTRHAAITAGYSPIKKAGGAGLVLMGKSSSGIFSVSNTTNSIFNKNGFMQANNNFVASLEIKTGNVSRLIFSETNFLLYGQEDMDDKTRDKYFLKENQLEKNYFYNKNIASVHYSTIHKTGARTHENSGFSFGMNLKNIYAAADTEKKDSIFKSMIHYENDCLKFSQVYPDMQIVLPKLLPIDCKGPFTYNLPVIVYGSLFQYNDTFITFLSQAVLFSWEIQKGMGEIPLYASTLTFNALYQDVFLTGLNRDMEIKYLSEDLNSLNKMEREKYAGGAVVLNIGGNTGALAAQGIYLSVAGKALYCLKGNNKGQTRYFVSSTLKFALF